MKHKVKHLHFIADNDRSGLRPCRGRLRLLAQTSADAAPVIRT
jgi:hypothetical protein